MLKNIMDRIWMYVALILLVIVLGDALWMNYKNKQMEQIKDAMTKSKIALELKTEAFIKLQKLSKIDQEAIAERDKLIQKLSKIKAASTSAIVKAGELSPQWSTQNVPIEILENIE